MRRSHASHVVSILGPKALTSSILGNEMRFGDKSVGYDIDMLYRERMEKFGVNEEVAGIMCSRHVADWFWGF